MKTSIITGILAVAAIGTLTGCNDFLDRNRFPEDTIVDSPQAWESEPLVKAECEAFYNEYTGYGNGASWVNNFVYRSISDDQCAKMQSGSGIIFATWEYQYAPTSNSIWDAAYQVIRRCNTVITNVMKNTMETPVKANYVGIARMNRAYQYWSLVRSFGDVCWVNNVLALDSAGLYGPRVDRNIVMDSVLADLDFAVANIAQKSNKIEFSRDMANAMKSQICLFEAAYARYHDNDEARARKYYGEVVKACDAVKDSYTLAPTYRQNYNSMRGVQGALNLQDNPEMIFCKTYIQGILGHSMIKYLSSKTPVCGMTKDAFDAYLFKDGKPLALTSENTGDAGKWIKTGEETDINGNVTEIGYVDISDVLAVRDGRLAQTIDPALGFTGVTNTRVGTTGKPISDPIASNTGYTIMKYVNPVMTYDQCTNDGSNAVCAPIYWLSNVYLDYLEARAELGELTDDDITKCMKPLWDRAGIDTSALSKSYLDNMNDPANNMGVSSLLWEIRRCRRCELMFDNYTRYWDLVRWHKLDLLDTVEHPEIALGANLSNVPAANTSGVVLTGGYIDGAKNAAGTSVRRFEERQYLSPLGTALSTLNRDKGINDFHQNPGWEGN